MPYWYDAILKSFSQLDVGLHFVFVQSEDDDSLDDLIFEDNLSIVTVDEDRFVERNWNLNRYQHMVNLRNMLLDKVRSIGPDLFLSIDSDIILNPNFYSSTIKHSEWDAVGGKVYLAKSRKEFPSYAKIASNGNLIRPDAEGFFKVDVLMALKLMKPSAYNVDYCLDKRGEDIGWSLSCRNQGLKLFWNGSVSSKHVILPEQIGVFDERVGY